MVQNGAMLTVCYHLKSHIYIAANNMTASPILLHLCHKFNYFQ